MSQETHFSDAVVNAIVKHMNDDHGDDSLMICQQFGTPDATAAAMTGFDQLGANFSATVAGARVELQVPWRGQITERAEVRAEVVWLFEEASRRAARSA